jgi:polyferredoxin
MMEKENPGKDGPPTLNTPVKSTLPPSKIRAAQRQGVSEHFSASDPTLDLTRMPGFGPFLERMLKSRKFQFYLIVPTQIIFWLVVISGIFGTLEPAQNFGTAITWYIWFALMFPATLLIGRAWCLVCPFGGIGDWVQRRAFWQRTQNRLGLGLKMPQALAEYGLLISAGVFIVLSWLEEFFNIAGPGAPILTSIMVLGIIAFSLITFLVFERRTFCRYLCPLSSLIGANGSTGVIAGFRPRDREVCLNCQTKECIRGGTDGYGCPWYTYPATADTNTYCGLCSECYKACPYDNIGVYAQKPLTSVIAPGKRAVMGWVIAALLGLVIFQQWNALPSYAALDTWLNGIMHFPHYPNPVDYLLTIGVVAGIFAGIAFLLSRTLSLKTKPAHSFRGWFAPLMYGLIPLVGADYLARVMPKFFNHAARLPSSIIGIFGKQVSWADFQILPNNWLVRLQYLVIAAGTAAGVYAMVKITGKDYKELAKNSNLARVIPVVVVVLLGAGMITLYYFMNGAE